MGGTEGLWEKEIQRDTRLRWFFYWIKRRSEDIFAKLYGGNFFSKIDLGDAYFQIPVEEVSSKLLCINTHRGSHTFERLPFRVKVAPAIIQQVMDTMLSGLDFAVAYLDDNLMESKSIIKHKKHVHKVFTKIQDHGFKIRDQMWFFFTEKIKYLGHIIDKHRRSLYSKRATEIKDMPAPDRMASLQSFLGLANYYQIFISNIHDLRAHLNELLKKDKLWVWSAECQEAFEKIKKNLMSDLFLIHYNPDLNIIVVSDARSYGVGACTKWLMGQLNRLLTRRELCFQWRKIFANWKRGFRDIYSLKVSSFYS